MKSLYYLYGTHHHTAHANKRWLERAWEHEFSDECEMLSCLIKEWSIRALGQLFDVDERTVTDRLDKCGIKNPRGPGGRNHTKSYMKQRSIMEKSHELCEYIFDLDRRIGK